LLRFGTVYDNLSSTTLINKQVRHALSADLQEFRIAIRDDAAAYLSAGADFIQFLINV
jgi:hypothetical protein